MPNTSLPSQPQMPGRYSGYEVVPEVEVVELFKREQEVEAAEVPPQSSHEVFPTPITKPTPIRTIQGGLPLSSVGGEIVPLDTFDRTVAERARQASTGIIGLRHDATSQVLNDQGLRRAA